jgi:hypothetical protein
MQMRRTIIRFLLIYTLVGLLLSIIVHFSLYFGWSLYERFPTIWMGLQVAVFVGLVGALLLKPALRLPKDVYDQPATRAYVLMTVLICIFLPYTLINYFYCDHKLKAGYPYVRDGQTFMYFPRGDHYRRLTPEQFREAGLYQARKTSGHWMLVQLFPLIGLYTANKWEKFD